VSLAGCSSNPSRLTMNPIPYIKAFAWIAMMALGCSFASDFWAPLLIGAAVLAMLVRLAR
jgi:hypothetical protein